MWEREKYRRDNNLIRLVPGMVNAYLVRDPWTKLKPAKIFQQPELLAELFSTANPDKGPKPKNHTAIMAAHSYLNACADIFENGLLNSNKSEKVDNMDCAILRSINKGLDFFVEWSQQLARDYPDFSLTDPREKRFISWQTFDLLRMCFIVQGIL